MFLLQLASSLLIFSTLQNLLRNKVDPKHKIPRQAHINITFEIPSCRDCVGMVPGAAWAVYMLPTGLPDHNWGRASPWLGGDLWLVWPLSAILTLYIWNYKYSSGQTAALPVWLLVVVARWSCGHQNQSAALQHCTTTAGEMLKMGRTFLLSYLPQLVAHTITPSSWVKEGGGVAKILEQLDLENAGVLHQKVSRRFCTM